MPPHRDPASFAQRQLDTHNARDLERVSGVQEAQMEVAAIYEVSPAGITKVWFVSGQCARGACLNIAV